MNKVTVVIPFHIRDQLLQNAVDSVGNAFVVKTFSSEKLDKKHFSFSVLKNEAMKGVDTEWIFLLDSDEVVSDELKEKIPELITNTTNDGFWIPRRTYISPTRYLKYGLLYPDYQLRLFRNKSEYKYKGDIHEYLTIPEEKATHIKESILHYPRHPKYVSFSNVKNLLPYIDIDAEEKITAYLKQEDKRLINGVKFAISNILTGVFVFIRLFLDGFIRGKGFLDGWAGLRAHLLFAYSIAGAYWLAVWKLVRNNYGEQ